MKLYKFRSFENIENMLDIIMNERLYCAPHKDLNDPFEGLFSTIKWSGDGTFGSCFESPFGSCFGSVFGSSKKNIYRSLEELPAFDEIVRVCSLSSEMSDIRMWSHYAAGHTGLVIEIELEDNPQLFKVNYSEGIQTFTKKITKNTKACEILSFKTNHWAYEQKYRIITDNDFFSITGKITSIYIGIRTKEIHTSLIRHCVSSEIPIYDTKINNKLVKIMPNKRIN